MCAACRLLNQYLLDGGVFNVLRAGKAAIGTADFGGPSKNPHVDMEHSAETYL